MGYSVSTDWTAKLVDVDEFRQCKFYHEAGMIYKENEDIMRGIASQDHSLVLAQYINQHSIQILDEIRGVSHISIEHRGDRDQDRFTAEYAALSDLEFFESEVPYSLVIPGNYTEQIYIRINPYVYHSLNSVSFRIKFCIYTTYPHLLSGTESNLQHKEMKSLFEVLSLKSSNETQSRINYFIHLMKRSFDFRLDVKERIPAITNLLEIGIFKQEALKFIILNYPSIVIPVKLVERYLRLHPHNLVDQPDKIIAEILFQTRNFIIIDLITKRIHQDYLDRENDDLQYLRYLCENTDESLKQDLLLTRNYKILSNHDEQISKWNMSIEPRRLYNLHPLNLFHYYEEFEEINPKEMEEGIREFTSYCETPMDSEYLYDVKIEEMSKLEGSVNNEKCELTVDSTSLIENIFSFHS